MESFFNNEELDTNLAMVDVAQSVGYENITSLVDYYSRMLNLALKTISALTDVPKTNVRENLEVELGLEDTLLGIKASMEASNEIIISVLSKYEQGDIGDLTIE
jgi:hypothetical protein